MSTEHAEQVTTTSEKPHSYLGRHIIAEFFQADFDALNEPEKLCEAMCKAATDAGATILSSHKHFFNPHGVSCVVIIQESNLCIHTWPEFGYAAADFFTCGDTVNPWKSFESLKSFLKATKFNCMELQRGSTQLLENPSLLNSLMHSAIRTCGSDNSDDSEFLKVKVPKGMVAIQAVELNDDLNQTVTTIAEPLLDTKSDFQKIVIAKNKWWGKTMWVDGVLNVCERDEFVYHEMIVHVPMMTHPDPRRVLIIGGGDGGSAREVLKHPNLEKFVMIDIDGVIVESCRKLMPEISAGAFDDPRMELIIGDGIDYVKKAADNSFDVIIVDSTDPLPDSVGEALFTKDFYNNCYRALAPNGVISTQALCPMRYDADIYKRSMYNIQHAF